MSEPQKGGEQPLDKNNLMSMVKWLCIAFVALVVLLIAHKVYKIISAPAAVVEKAADGMTDAMKSGTEVVKDGAVGVLNRLVVPTNDQDGLNSLSEAAFETLHKMEPTDPAGMKDRLFRRTNFGGHEGKVCSFEATFADAPVPIHVAVDNVAYAKAKALGGDADRLIRMVILVGDDDVSFNSSWDETVSAWVMKWKATTVKKPVDDAIAESRIFDILRTIPDKC